jgi:hypothetical protein
VGDGFGNQSESAWGDFEGDGDLDLVLTGHGDFPNYLQARVFRNDCGTTNTRPGAPTNLSVTFNGTRATFQWDAATDAETPSAGLSYNLRVGTAPGLGDIVPPMALASGVRSIPALGNAMQNLSWEIELPGLGPYYWSVQSIDGAYAGSAFAPEQSTAQSGVEPSTAWLANALWSGGPNPFSSATTIRFSQVARGLVTLDVYDVAGRCVRQLVNEELDAGRFTREWDGRDDAERPVSSGLYFVRMKTRDFSRSYRVSVVR